MPLHVRLLAPQAADRQLLTAFYLAHAEGRLRQRVEQGGLSLDPRCVHIGVLDDRSALLATAQMLPAHMLTQGDHWPAFFESHTVPGAPTRRLLLFQPLAVGGESGRQALTSLLEAVVAEAEHAGTETLLLAAAPRHVGEFERQGFAVYTNGRRGSGMGFMVPMVRLLAPVAAGVPAGMASRWLGEVVARRQQFIVRDPSRPGVGGGLLGRLSLKGVF